METTIAGEHAAPWAQSVAQNGYAIIPDVLGRNEVKSLVSCVSDIAVANANVRNLMEVAPCVRDLAGSSCIRGLVTPLLGDHALPVRAILFDKTPNENWKVPWHQDLTIAVKAKVDVPGYGPWSVKAGVVHTQPAVSILENMIAVRIHLDDCGPTNGQLRVIPGSHLIGKLTTTQVRELGASSGSETFIVYAGGVLLMRPLLLHASSPSLEASHRRVIHIEYASCKLADGLEWREA